MWTVLRILDRSQQNCGKSIPSGHIRAGYKPSLYRKGLALLARVMYRANGSQEATPFNSSRRAEVGSYCADTALEQAVIWDRGLGRIRAAGMASEKEKMISERMYYSFGPELLGERMAARENL